MADGWPYEYRAHIVRASWFGKPRWRYVVERKWVHWSIDHTSRRFRSKEDAEAAANRWLDSHEKSHDKAFV